MAHLVYAWFCRSNPIAILPIFLKALKCILSHINSPLIVYVINQHSRRILSSQVTHQHIFWILGKKLSTNINMIHHVPCSLIPLILLISANGSAW